MNGELVSGGRENLRVLVDYKGRRISGRQMQDDLLLFSLRPDASPNPLALAVVNFPPIRGEGACISTDCQERHRRTGTSCWMP